ncbi:MAG TPA: endolytic transglycosylase MltG [Cytophagaceae bacterium]|jgi:UPF0755 protein|nr:endolytic transglycosylase MltG [Cytophagaceae bacterium]
MSNSNIKKSGDFKKWLIVGLGISFISFSFYAYQIYFTANFNLNKEKDSKKPSVYLLIPTGGNFQNVLDTLEKHKWVEDELSFLFLSKLMNYRDHVKPGRYELKPDAANLEVIKMLKRGQQTPVKVTFNNLRLKRDLAERFGSILEPRPVEIYKLLNDTGFVRKFGFDTTNIVCMFLPNTYEMYWNISAKELFEKMNKEYKKFWNAERMAKANTIGLTPVQVSVLASIVEAETNKPSERPIVAGVYINRLKVDMPLQADPTLVFICGDFNLKRVLDIHKENNSPYNTYKFKGLPPGPIRIPDIKTLDAVLNYEKTKYLYFCASSTNLGYHAFGETYKEQINNAKLYQKYLNENNIR